MANDKPMDPENIDDKREPHICKHCRHTTLLWKHEVKTKCQWRCPNCDKSNDLPIPAEKKKDIITFRVMLKDGPALDVKAEYFRCENGLFLFHADGGTFLYLTQSDVRSIVDLAKAEGNIKEMEI